jgi:serine phosphatase RsbU (regulator of sigma subunit)
LKRDAEISEARDRNQMLVIYLFILGFVFTLVFIGLLYRSNNLKQKANRELSEKNLLITEQKKEITDSIQYASRIQNAMLTPNDYINTLLPEHFILFRPRDIVSGDFYWVTKKDGRIICAIADCTGHGVPGAFMSMLGISSLNEIISKDSKQSASTILDELSNRLLKSLRQSDRPGELLDGIDMALLIIDQVNGSLEFAGAMNSLIVISDGELTEHQTDKKPIGYHIDKKATPFTNHKIPIRKKDVLYAFTDGYQDQFGGKSGKKFMIRKFKNLLLQIHKKPMEEQKSILENSMDEWMSAYKQVDDILVMGIRI